MGEMCLLPIWCSKVLFIKSWTRTPRAPGPIHSAAISSYHLLRLSVCLKARQGKAVLHAREVRRIGLPEPKRKQFGYDY